MADLVECFECGKEFNDVHRVGCCAKCDLEIRAREMPDHLKEMKALFAGGGAGTPGQRLLKAMMEKNPDRFMARLEEAEAKWREQVARVTAGPVKESEGAVGDGQSERVEDLIEELLAEGTS